MFTTHLSCTLSFHTTPSFNSAFQFLDSKLSFPLVRRFTRSTSKSFKSLYATPPPYPSPACPRSRAAVGTPPRGRPSLSKCARILQYKYSRELFLRGVGLPFDVSCRWLCHLLVAQFVWGGGQR
jgi:hypothetical protein